MIFASIPFGNQLIAALVFGLVCMSVSAAATRVELVKKGVANATIVVASKPTPAADLAAAEVQYLIEKMTGARLPVVNDGQAVSGNRLLVGESRFTKKLGLDVSQYHYMESLVRFYPDTVVLLGRDDTKDDCRSFKNAPGHIRIDTASVIDYAKANGIKGQTQKIFIPGIFDYQGSLRATYRFLEEWCDVRFFGATPVNTHIPKQDSLVVSGSEHHHRSGLDTKSGALGVNGRRSGRSEYGPRPTASQTALFSRRMRWGGEPWYVNHTFEHFNYKSRFMAPVQPTDKEAKDYQRQLREYEKHKREFEKVLPGLKPTGRSHQFCYSTGALIDQIAQDARDFFDGKLGDNVDMTVQNLQGRGNTFFLVPFDVGGYCQCEKCKPLQDIGHGRAAGDFNTGESSDYVFTLVNAVARKVAKTHPDKFIGTLAYEGYYWPPKSFEMEKNVTMSPCVHTKFWSNHPVTTFKNEFKRYKEWVKKAKAGKMGAMGMWNYDFDVPQCATSYYARRRAEYVKMFLKDGVRHIFFCGAPPMLEMYVTNRIYENPALDVDDLVDDFFEKYFGPARKPMKELQRLMEDYTSNPKYRPLEQQGGLLHDWISLYEFFLTDAQLIEVRKVMDKAKALALNEPYASRLEAWDRTMVGRYEEELPAHFAEKAEAARESIVAYTDVAKGYISGVTAFPAWHWYSQVPPESLVDGRNMIEQQASHFGTKGARLNHARKSFKWNSVVRATGAWILFDLGGEYELDELHVWNYNDKDGNTQHGMRAVEIAYARNKKELYAQKWRKFPSQVIDRASKDGKEGADSVIDFKEKRVRYVYIHTLGAEGQGNWADPNTASTSKDGVKEGRNQIDAATGMGGSAFDHRKFTIGLGQVRFYGKPRQLPKPELAISEGRLKLAVQGYDDAQIRYTLDGSIPSKTSPLYRSPIAISSDVVLRARAFGSDLRTSEYVPVKVRVGEVVMDSAIRRDLTDGDMAGVQAAVLSVELYDSDTGPYLKHLDINGEKLVPVPQSKKNQFDLNFIPLPQDKLKSLKARNHIKFSGGAGDAYKLRNVTMYVQLPDGTWAKSETDTRILCSQTRRNWARSEGIVMNPIQTDIQFPAPKNRPPR